MQLPGLMAEMKLIVKGGTLPTKIVVKLRK
jgi:hypothetical protein